MRCDEIADLLHAYGDGELDLVRSLEVERHLQEIPHTPLLSSERRYQRALARYKDWHARHPDRSPDYFEDRYTWML